MMKNILIIFVVLAVFLTPGKGAVSVLQNSRNDKYPGKCYYDKVNPPLILNPGAKATIRETCTEAHCSEDFSMSFFSCGIVQGPDNCKLSKIDVGKDYPNCCPFPVCP